VLERERVPSAESIEARLHVGRAGVALLALRPGRVGRSGLFGSIHSRAHALPPPWRSGPGLGEFVRAPATADPRAGAWHPRIAGPSRRRVAGFHPAHCAIRETGEKQITAPGDRAVEEGEGRVGVAGRSGSAGGP